MNDKIRTIIIDPDDYSIAEIEILLKKNFSKIEVVGSANEIMQGISLIHKENPQLIFMDAHLLDAMGFDVIHKIKANPFEIIILATNCEYALKAFNISALHYLLKPISHENLREALRRYSRLHNKESLVRKLEIVKESLTEKPQKIMLPTNGVQNIFSISDIVRCEANNNYTKVYFNNNRSILISKTLQSLCLLLSDFNFSRIHNKHLINLRYIKKFSTGRCSSVVLFEDTELSISQTYKTPFLTHFKNYVKSM